MKIEFETDINGYQDARKFKSLIDIMLKHDAIDASLKSFATSLREQLEEFLAKPEFEGFEDAAADAHYSASHDESAGEGLTRFFRHLIGPSRRELELSKQRHELIARSERAENSAFEALAESAEISRERDELKHKLKELEAELAKYRENV